jgi:Flp pilus assembly protein TadD
MACGSDEDGRPGLMGDHPAAKGLAALRAGDAATAVKWFDELVAAEPAGVPGHFLRAEAVDRLGDRVRSRALLEDLAKRFPVTEGACRERLAILSLRDGHTEAARAELLRAVELGWSNVPAVTSDPAYSASRDAALLEPLFERARANARDE